MVPATSASIPMYIMNKIGIEIGYDKQIAELLNKALSHIHQQAIIQLKCFIIVVILFTTKGHKYIQHLETFFSSFSTLGSTKNKNGFNRVLFRHNDFT